MKYFDWRDMLRISFLLLVTSFVLIPVCATILGGFKTLPELRMSPIGLPSVWRLEYYTAIISSLSFWRFLGNTLVIALVTVFLTLLVGAMAAYVFAHIRFFGKKFLYSYILLGLMFPFATGIIPLFIKVRDLGMTDSIWGVILPQTAFGLAFSIMLFRTFFEQMPHELFEAARVDGCGYMRFFFRFTLPLSMPILSTVAVFVFVGSWNNYLLPLVIINDQTLYPWTLGMLQFRGTYFVEWNRILAFVALTLVPSIAFFISAQKYIVAGLTGGAVKG